LALLHRICLFFFSCCLFYRYLHSFPTRRSSDLLSTRRISPWLCGWGTPMRRGRCLPNRVGSCFASTTSRASPFAVVQASSSIWKDRKSTRLNSSHDQISYAVFCLKKKNNITSTT